MTRLYSVDPHKPSANVHFDWLTAVVPIPDNYYSFTDVNTIDDWVTQLLIDLNLNFKFEPMKHGLYNYDNAYNSGDASIIVAYDEDTVMMQFSGTGLESFESVLKYSGGNTLANFITEVFRKYNGTFSRVDACCNFFNYGYEYSARYAGEKAKVGELVTRASKVRLVHEFGSKGAITSDDAYTSSDEGYTCYIGSNPKQLRIYNKLAERSSKVNQLFYVDDWSRWEFQLNGKYAQDFIDMYYLYDCNLSLVWKSWLAKNYRFIEIVGHQEKRSRYPNASWYDKIIDGAIEINLRHEKQKPTLERTQSWLDKQVFPSLTDVYMTRLKKYLNNGVEYEDAKRLALKFVTESIDEKIVNEEYHTSLVDKWLLENGDTNE